MTVREQYRKYSLFVLILGLGTTVFIELIPFLGGILGAVTIYVLLRNQMVWLTEHKQWQRSWAATLLLGEAILCFLIPLSLIVWMMIGKIQHLTLNPQSFIKPAEHLASLIHQKTGYNLLDRDNLTSFISLLPKVGQWLMESIGSFIVNVLVLLFVLYFMLIGGRNMELYLREILPFDHAHINQVLREIHMIVRSNAIGIPLLAVLQGTVAYIGYLLFGIPSALFWGMITCFATVIPLLGTTLVWLPLAAYLAIVGKWGFAIGLTLYAVIVIAQTDNLGRFILQKKMADTHPLVTIFGVVIGLSLFGFMGVIFGPVLLEIFILCVHIFKDKYLTPSSRETAIQKRQER